MNEVLKVKKFANIRVRKDIMSLASGTLAKLFGCGNYSDIDIAQANWLAWFDDLEPHTQRSYDTWQSAWFAYSNTKDAASRVVVVAK